MPIIKLKKHFKRFDHFTVIFNIDCMIKTVSQNFDSLEKVITFEVINFSKKISKYFLTENWTKFMK